MVLMRIFNPPEDVYIVLGIDGQACDQVLGVFSCYELAKRFCVTSLNEHDFYDVWIEKHEIQKT
jgi:hypothetical protein